MPRHGWTPAARRINGRRLERNRKFVDSPLEGDGFELLVPRCAPTTDRAQTMKSRSPKNQPGSGSALVSDSVKEGRSRCQTLM